SISCCKSSRRYPVAPPGATTGLGEGSGFRRSVATTPAGGYYTTVSEIDHVERRFAARRLNGTPLYVTTGFATSAIRGEWLWEMAAHLIYVCGDRASSFISSPSCR